MQTQVKGNKSLANTPKIQRNRVQNPPDLASLASAFDGLVGEIALQATYHGRRVGFDQNASGITVGLDIALRLLNDSRLRERLIETGKVFTPGDFQTWGATGGKKARHTLDPARAAAMARRRWARKSPSTA